MFETMTLTCRDLPAMTIAGIGAPFISSLAPDTNAHQVIPPLWATFLARRHELTPTHPTQTWGLCASHPEGHETLFYLAGQEVDPAAPVPEGMQTLHVPAGRYAFFTHKGPLSDFPRTTRAIYHEWLPKAGVTIADTPHLELYDHRFNPMSPESEIDILVPVI